MCNSSVPYMNNYAVQQLSHVYILYCTEVFTYLMSAELNEDPNYAGGDTTEEEIGLSTLLYRSCSDECRYHCMWHATKLFEAGNRPTAQFFGKVSCLD